MTTFYKTFAVFIEWPLLALIPAALFLTMAYLRHSRFAAITGWVWAAYAIYEFGMHTRLLCSGECNIRIDLLAIYPALVVLSISAVIVTFRARNETRV